MTKISFQSLLCASASLVASWASPALAQSQPANPADQTPTAGAVAGGIQDIVVTARRREESLQNAPVTVTAMWRFRACTVKR